jgi:hypothetical protein
MLPGGFGDIIEWFFGCSGRAAASTDMPLGDAKTSPARLPVARNVLVRGRGLPIPRPVPACAVAPRFVAWMVEQDLVGEFLWRDLWAFYVEWFCPENTLDPLPNGMRAKFAEELAGYCARGQVRMVEGGRRRRLTTYTIQAPERVRPAAGAA